MIMVLLNAVLCFVVFVKLMIKMCLNSDAFVMGDALSPVLPRVSGAGGEAWLGGSPVGVHVPQQVVSQWLWPHPSVC